MLTPFSFITTYILTYTLQYTQLWKVIRVHSVAKFYWYLVYRIIIYLVCAKWQCTKVYMFWHLTYTPSTTFTFRYILGFLTLLPLHLCVQPLPTSSIFHFFPHPSSPHSPSIRLPFSFHLSQCTAFIPPFLYLLLLSSPPIPSLLLSFHSPPVHSFNPSFSTLPHSPFLLSISISSSSILFYFTILPLLPAFSPPSSRSHFYSSAPDYPHTYF